MFISTKKNDLTFIIINIVVIVGWIMKIFHYYYSKMVYYPRTNKFMDFVIFFIFIFIQIWNEKEREKTLDIIQRWNHHHHQTKNQRNKPNGIHKCRSFFFLVVGHFHFHFISFSPSLPWTNIDPENFFFVARKSGKFFSGFLAEYFFSGLFWAIQIFRNDLVFLSTHIS